MIAARQIAFGRGVAASKPYDAEVEYLESTGTQWIDTGVLADTAIGPIHIGFDGSSTSWSFIMGGGDDSSNGYGFRAMFSEYGTTVSAGFAWTSFLQYWKHPKVSPCQKISVLHGFLGLNDSYNNSLSFTGSYNYNFILFGRNVGGVVEPSRYKIYFAQIGDLRDLIPVRKGNVGYMYDSVSGQLFGNAGTGEFVLGDDI